MFAIVDRLLKRDRGRKINGVTEVTQELEDTVEYLAQLDVVVLVETLHCGEAIQLPGYRSSSQPAPRQGVRGHGVQVLVKEGLTFAVSVWKQASLQLLKVACRPA